jgi:hypothetical protein
MKHLVLLLFLLSQAWVLPQTYIYQGSIGKFNNASSVHINPAGFLFITDSGNDDIYKMDTLGQVLKSTGGHGWAEATFDNPVNIYATPLNIYVSDKNNHRIQRFDKDLNPVSSLYTRDNDDPNSRFGYPLSCVISAQGDMFILDSENKRILKFDLFGNFIQNFGGYDYGKYALSNPVGMAGDRNNNLYVIDGNTILIYDQFGNGIGELKGTEDFSAINIIFNNMTLNSKDKIYFHDLSHRTNQMENISIDSTELNGDIKSTLIFNSKLYVLTSKEIQIFQRP